MSKSCLGKIPCQDKKAVSLELHVSKIKDFDKIMWDALNPFLVINNPTQSELRTMDIAKPEDQTVAHLYKANENYSP